MITPCFILLCKCYTLLNMAFMICTQVFTIPKLGGRNTNTKEPSLSLSLSQIPLLIVHGSKF